MIIVFFFQFQIPFFPLLIRRKVTDFYISIVYSATLPKFLIISRRVFFCPFFYIFYINNNVIYKNNLISFFQFCVPFIFISCFIELARSSSTLLKVSGGRGYLRLLPAISRKTLWFSLLSTMLAVEALLYTFFIKMKIFSILLYLEFLS